MINRQIASGEVVSTVIFLRFCAAPGIAGAGAAVAVSNKMSKKIKRLLEKTINCDILILR